MRKALFALVASVVAIATVGVALAATDPNFKQNYDLKYTAKKGLAGTGFNTKINATFAPGMEPGTANKVIVKFANGTKFDTSVPPICKATNDQIKNTRGKVCSKAQIGSGSAGAELGGGAVPDSKIQVFNIKNGILFHVFDGPAEVFIKGSVRGSVLTTKVDPLPLGARLTFFNVNVKPVSKTVIIKKGSKRIRTKKNYATTPKCTGGKFTTTAVFNYSNAPTQTIKSTSPCR